MAPAGVVRMARVTPAQASLWILLSLFLALAVLQPGRQVVDGRMMETYSQKSTLGFRPHSTLKHLLQAHEEL